MRTMLFSPDRHELLSPDAWDETVARRTIARIVEAAESRFSAETLWPTHPNDSPRTAPSYMLYWGACGVFWALRYLEARGACRLKRDYGPHVDALLEPNRKAMGHQKTKGPFGSYLMGDTGIQLLKHWHAPSDETRAELARLIEATRDHPARELMWGAPGTLLAALFLHRQTGEAIWAELFRATARQLWSQRHWSPEHRCHYWTQDLYGNTSTYLDAVHGFVATASVLIGGRHLLEAAEWADWEECIGHTVRQTAEWEGACANWRARLDSALLRDGPGLVQFCHGAPGFVICLGDFPGGSLDELLVAGGETTWAAGPLRKGSNLCHGTGGNGYAFLKLYRRLGDAKWLGRARAFAMHGIRQTELDLAKFGQMRYSLWTGDLGFAVYLLDCIEGTDRFPTLDVFFGDGGFEAI
jgi:hypothetical protein